MDELSVSERIALSKHINSLTPTDFGILLFALDVPAGIVPESSAAQGERVVSLLKWLESPTGGGIPQLMDALDEIAPMQGAYSQNKPLNSLSELDQGNAAKTVKEAAIDPQATIQDYPQQQTLSVPTPPQLLPKPKQASGEREIITISLSNDVSLELVKIPSGTFYMGQKGNQHRVEIAYTFYMGKYPVTQEQWYSVALMPAINIPLSSDPSRFAPFMGEQLPVECVSWHEANEFCERVSSQYSDGQIRLPLEAEWEYSCRANTATLFHFGDSISTKLVNCYPYWLIGGYAMTTDVEQFPPNDFGLHDMHGNVWEWCFDWVKYDNGASIDFWSPWRNGESSGYVVRGGSWYDLPRHCRSASRRLYYSCSSHSNLGFRVILVP